MSLAPPHRSVLACLLAVILLASGCRVSVEPALDRDDIDCSEDAIGSNRETPFIAAHFVVDGMLGYSCFGERDDRLLEAWRILQIITPQGQLSDLALFGGFSSGIEDETTLAFVNRVDDEGAIYQMSINLDEAESDPDELMLTMAHEFSHVFTNLPSQLDRFTLPEECATWDNGEGCYRADSLMWEWIELFWDDGRIDEIDPWAAPSLFDGDVRCSLDPSFIGSYAATNPEEDFAESFSAFVFRLEVEPGMDEKMAWFEDQPGLVEFRDRASAADLGPLRNAFGGCG